MRGRGNGDQKIGDTEVIAARAHAKWMARSARCAEDNDWLEAETELQVVGSLSGEIENLQERFLDLAAGQRRREQCVAAEHGISRVLAVSSNLPDAAPGLLHVMGSSLDWDFGALWRVDERTELLRCVETWHACPQGAAFEESCRGYSLAPGFGLPGEVWSTGERTWIADVCGRANFVRRHAALRAGLHAAAGFPLRDGERVLGVMEFLSREVRSPDTELLDTMDSIGCQISQFIERREAERRLYARETDQRIAHEIQQKLLPRRVPKLAGFQIAGRMCPANVVGGDCFDFFPMPARPNQPLCVVVADASGHGTAAALLMAETRASLRALAFNCPDLSSILALTNCRLAADLQDAFITLFVACIDATTRTLTYASAGHWPAFILDRHGSVRHVLESTSMPLGVDAKSVFPESSAIALESGDLLFVYTDGLVEAFSPSGAMFGASHALQTVGRHREQAPERVLDVLFRSVAEFCGVARPVDDMTAVVIAAE